MKKYDVQKWKDYYSNYALSSHNVVALNKHYNVNLKELDIGIKQSIDNYGMFPYPKGINKGHPSTWGTDTWPGYYGLCFKSFPNAENPLQDGLSSNSVNHDWKTDFDTNFTEKTDVWFPYLDELVSKFRGTVTQLRLIKLEAGCNLGQRLHMDYPWYKGIRLHICLTPDIDYTWTVLDKDYTVKRSNKIYFLDAGKPHNAKNKDGNRDRYVLNINVLPKLDYAIDYQIERNLV
jgi:hypothetical protein